METDLKKFIKKLQEAKENGVSLVLVYTENGRTWTKDLSKLDMNNPEIKEQGSVWFKNPATGTTQAFVPKLIKEIRPVGKPII